MADLSLTVLGCCGSYAGPGGACSGYLVDDGRTRLWVDAGSGTLANLQRHVPDGAVDALLLSHEHPDHWTDLEGFVNVLRFVTGIQGMPVYAPPGLRGHTFGETAPLLDWQEVSDGDRVPIGSIEVAFSRTDHGPETLAMRFDSVGSDHPSIAYSADTGPGWSFEAFGDDVDLAFCEATLPSSLEGTLQHMTARQAGESAQEARVGRLVLTHLWPTIDAERSRLEGSEAFGADVDVAALHRRYTAGEGTAGEGTA